MLHRALWAKATELRELRDKVRKMENEWKKTAVHCEEQEEDAKPEEDGKMDVDEETTVGKRWRFDREVSSRKRVSWKVSRAWMKQARARLKKTGKKRVAQIEQRKNDPLPEYEHMQKRSQKHALSGGQVGTVQDTSEKAQ